MSYSVLMHKLIAAIAGTIAMAGSAEAQPVSPSRTVQMPRVSVLQCSVTAFGPRFAFGFRGHIDLSYGAGTSCRGGEGGNAAGKFLKVWVQVAGSGANRGRYFDVAGTTRTSFSTANPVRLSSAREAFLGHAYRIAAEATAQRGDHITAGAVVGPTIAP
jgi:hypothetical protein